MKGIVWDGAELQVVEGLEVRGPGPHEVTVRIVNSGVCHSDVSVTNGTIPFPTPVVLGHEGAGIVEEVGSAVGNVAVGDHVVLSTLGNCGTCPACDTGRPTMCKGTFGAQVQPFTLEGRPHYRFANVSSFAERTVVKANQAVAIPEEVPLAAASLIGCGVLTGAGAVLNRARVQAGQSAAVIGVGGIGCNALQALALTGANPIIAIDTNAAKEPLARTFGATHFVNPAESDPHAAVRDIAGDGVDFAFECVGSKALMEQAITLLDWHGTLVILGVTPFGTKVDFAPEQLYHDKTIMGCRYGSSRPQQDIRRYAELYLAGRLKLDELVTKVYPMDDIHEVLHDMHEGRLARGVLDVTPV